MRYSLRSVLSNSIVALILACISISGNAKSSVVIVQGLAGEDYYQRHFDEQVEKISEASAKLVEEGDLIVLSPEVAKDEILATLKRVLENSASNDMVFLYLIGHGSYDGRNYKFNISGADFTGAELLELYASAESTAVLINTSSSSGGLLKLFEEAELDNLHLVTATKSGAERTATRFGRHLADALLASEADIDKNQSISLQEAFDFAVRETQGFFDTEGLLATENARLQIGAQSAAPGQIRLANLVARPSVSANQELANLYQQRDELDRQIDTLRLRRINMSDEDYLQQFQGLMIELSLLQGQIDDEEGAQ